MQPDPVAVQVGIFALHVSWDVIVAGKSLQV